MGNVGIAIVGSKMTYPDMAGRKFPDPDLLSPGSKLKVYKYSVRTINRHKKSFSLTHSKIKLSS